MFHEITKQAVEEAFEHPREIDMQLVNAQQARRILDRLVGYEISPLLWLKVKLGLSAGRVQSAALRMIVDREREITAFVPQEWWSLEAELHKDIDPNLPANLFTATLHSRKGSRKLNINDEATARGLEAELQGAAYSVDKVEKKPRRQRPAPPFITSTLQQDAGRKLRFTAQRTMAVAQQLYEGLNVGNEGSVGLITYMRTDSVNVADTAVRETRDYVRQRFGKEYVPDKPRAYRTRSKNAQEAHEAIRPTSVGRTPQAMAAYLDRDQLRLYTLIWERMVASQMADALLEATTVEIDARCVAPSDSVFRFRATGSVLKFPGFRAVYLEGRDDAADGGENALPELVAGDGLKNQKLEANQHFTQPPPRFTEATLIREMEEKGIGRPSTYAPTIATLVEREYVQREQRRLSPTDLGCTVTDLLTERFADVMAPEFTAKMEEDLDSVAQGEQDWVPMLRDFYGPFHQAVNLAEQAFTPSCEKCGRPMTMMMGRFGRFLACSGYPACQNTRNMRDNAERPPDEPTDEICEKCERPMVIKTGRYGRFLACTGYNAEDNPCDNRRNIVTKSDVPCPKCGGDLVQRRAREIRSTLLGLRPLSGMRVPGQHRAPSGSVPRLRGHADHRRPWSRPAVPIASGRATPPATEHSDATPQRRSGVGWRWRLAQQTSRPCRGTPGVALRAAADLLERYSLYLTGQRALSDNTPAHLRRRSAHLLGLLPAQRPRPPRYGSPTPPRIRRLPRHRGQIRRPSACRLCPRQHRPQAHRSPHFLQFPGPGGLVQFHAGPVGSLVPGQGGKAAAQLSRKAGGHPTARRARR